jgi:hypothetical protein
MRASRLVTFLVLVPAATLAQSSTLGQAQKARADVVAGTEAHQRAADAQYQQGDVPAQRADEQVPGAGAEPKEEEQGIELGRAAARLQGEEPEPKEADAAPAHSQRHTVQRGDTLWDLSGKYLSNPWYWPKVWSYNPEITNPHFIYPGNVVRLFPEGDEGPARVAPLGPVADQGDLEPPRELEDFSRADMKKPQEIGDDDDVAVVGPYKIGYVPPKGVFARHDTFVTPSELAESGVLHAAFEEKLLLSLHDRAYVRFAQPARVKVGETYVLYKTVRPVKHPVTGELFGYQSTILGSAKVVAVDQRAVTVVIGQAFDPIERGALLAPWQGKIVKQVQRRPNQRALAGVILAAQQDVLTELGEHHVVFVDKGRTDGVEEGNVFTVVRSGDPQGRERNEIHDDPSLPPEDMGTLLIVDAQQTSSTALVLKSLRELYVGDKVEMRTAAPVVGAGGG